MMSGVFLERYLTLEVERHSTVPINREIDDLPTAANKHVARNDYVSCPGFISGAGVQRWNRELPTQLQGGARRLPYNWRQG